MDQDEDMIDESPETDGTFDTKTQGKSSKEINLNTPIVPDLVIPVGLKPWRQFTEDQRLQYRQDKLKNIQIEKKLPEGWIAACPSCKYRVTMEKNFTLNGMICYNCGSRGWEKPLIRKKEYFNEVLGTKKVRKIEYTKEGKVVSEPLAPIKRWHRRKFLDSDIFSRQDILNTISSKYDDVYNLRTIDIRNCALFAFLFQVGSRIEEVVGVPEYTIGPDQKLHSIKGKYEIEPVKKSQISIKTVDIDGVPTEFFCVEGLAVLKRRDQQTINKEESKLVRTVIRRNVMVPMKVEEKFIFYINRWLSKIKNPDDYVFPMRASNAYKIVYRYFGRKYCHMFRHWRASDLSATYNFNGLQAMHFFGWASAKQFERYSHLSNIDLIHAMLRQVKK